MSTSQSTTDPAAAPADATQWFTREVEPHGPQLKSYLRGAFPAVRDVDDVVQESFLRTWKARVAQPIQSGKGFLFQVARRIALDLLRRGRSSPIDAGRDLAALPVLDQDADTARQAALAERKRLLIDAVASLPSRYREIVILRKLEEVSQKEVAGRLGISERTVENLLARGIKRCEEYLRRRGVRDLFDA